MPVMADRWIRRMAAEHGMIEPFVETQRRDGVISFGLSSYGYDARVADEFKVFTNVDSAIVDPKKFAPTSLRRPARPGVRHPAQQLRARPHARIFPRSRATCW